MISGDLSRQFSTYLLGKRCEVYAAPFDVRFPAPGESDEATSTVVQPDIVVVCDPAKLDDKGCQGAPDLVIEILPSYTSSKDLKEKFLLYERAGVSEYWVVHPAEMTVMVFLRGPDGAYGRPARFAADDRVPVGVLPDPEIELTTVFAE